MAWKTSCKDVTPKNLTPAVVLSDVRLRSFGLAADPFIQLCPSSYTYVHCGSKNRTLLHFQVTSIISQC